MPRSVEMRYPARVLLGQFPTPIEELARLSKHLGGPAIYAKRDDQTGLATGGNKTRKLEFLLADAQTQGCNHLITMGAPQSNHCRQTAAAAVRCGMDCSIVLSGEPPEHKLGNLLLDELLGATVHWSGSRTRETAADELLAISRKEGRRPYLVPLGGSSPVGALGYVMGMQEAMWQLEAQRLPIDTMVLASSSAGTQAGLVLGARLFGYPGAVLGISVDASATDLTKRVRQIAMGSARLLGLNGTINEEDLGVEVNADFLGGGYAVVGDLEREAIRTVARTEGLLLDPVYTGRAMGALINLIGQRAFDRKQRILFWHTGGTAALSAFADTLIAQK